MPELETSYTVDQDHPDAATEEIAAISDLITGEATKEPEQQEAQQPEPDQPDVEAHDISEPDSEPEPEPPEPQQVDYDQVIPMPDGLEAMTVGQLKDHYRENQNLQMERDDWESARSQQQSELMAARQQLTQLADMLKDVKPEVVEYVQNMQQLDGQREAELLLQVYPEWADADKKAAARATHLDTVKFYGFDEWEYSAIQDHRIIRLLQDLSRYRQREAAGQAKREQIKADLPKGQKTIPRKQTDAQKRAALIQRAKRGDENAKISAISSLISEG